jgi:3-hydroxybutyrate dehydrogenase
MVAGLTQVEKGPDPIDVAMAALDIMQSVTPKIRYMVTETVGQADASVRPQISKMLELNNGQVQQFDRAKLIEMLDEEIDKDSKNKAAAK